MLIGELSKLAGCDAGTIRFYEREGLLREPQRASSGYRNYSEAHLAQLNFVRHCRSLGMTLAEIRLLQGFQADPEAPCAEINELIDRQIARIRQQIEGLHQLEVQLAALRRCCDANLRASECGILRALALSSDNGEVT